MGNDRGCSLGSVGLAFVGGGLFGAAMALLLAPQSGRESRDQMRRYARRAGDHLHEFTDTAAQALDEAVDKGREFIKDKQGVVTEAIEAGRTAMQREHDRLAGSKKV